MCDLFALSSLRKTRARRSLPIFGVRARENVDGWGIGFFRGSRARVEKSAEQVYVPGHLHDGFQRLARVIESSIIIAHIRLRSSGDKDECHAHPFILPIFGQQWLFAHNGKAASIEGYETLGERLHAQSDSARSFEYIRDHLTRCYRSCGRPFNLFEALRTTTTQMLRDYPGRYNYLLTNGSVLLAFTNHRRLMVLKDSRHLERSLLLTTIAEGLSSERWRCFQADNNRHGLLLVIVGGEIAIAQPVAIQ